mmetsp:Transcript_22743/g.53715  ORF Transcript_22743/g.53715 Transcript_22743/m.53715 type:complete len:99 (-) Transcript_22743:456-752(-)|eukprot:CAMPEP_0172382958 /NCGR_PEP_ID=MMETSP1061-20121228/894_1 /TAXON_ID=37318 /ORGANISM="Pseudo-nitzschia pungens, Strain cf. pungens" /LENGTH=98 /DNA_ID=CAMNT_0013111037 /DNA_START=84 /DNA_END=380 /DNA_ORIENTATION=-
MVSRGRRNSKRYPYGDENNEGQDGIDPMSDTDAQSAARMREAHFLAHEALRRAKEAKEAAIRLRQYREAISCPYRGGNNINVDDTPTQRESGSTSRSL